MKAEFFKAKIEYINNRLYKFLSNLLKSWKSTKQHKQIKTKEAVWRNSLF